MKSVENEDVGLHHGQDVPSHSVIDADLPSMNVRSFLFVELYSHPSTRLV